VLSLVITAAYHLTAIQKLHFGPFKESWRGALGGRDVDLREAATLVPLAIVVVVLGFWPMPLLTAVAGGVQDLVAALAGPTSVAGP
jgi:NADH-quinone oxidoreductase subunit M